MLEPSRVEHITELLSYGRLLALPAYTRQAGRQTYRPDRQAEGQTDRQADRQTGRQADRQTGRLADWQTDRQAGRQIGRLAGKQVFRYIH